MATKTQGASKTGRDKVRKNGSQKVDRFTYDFSKKRFDDICPKDIQWYKLKLKRIVESIDKKHKYYSFICSLSEKTELSEKQKGFIFNWEVSR